MKKSGIILKAGIVAMAAMAISSASYSQADEKKAAQTITKKQSVTSLNTMRGSDVTAVEAKKLIMNNDVKASSIQKTSGRACIAKSTMKPNSISRKNFNNLPADRQKFVLSNSDKYTIVD